MGSYTALNHWESAPVIVDATRFARTSAQCIHSPGQKVFSPGFLRLRPKRKCSNCSQLAGDGWPTARQTSRPVSRRGTHGNLKRRLAAGKVVIRRWTNCGPSPAIREKGLQTPLVESGGRAIEQGVKVAENSHYESESNLGLHKFIRVVPVFCRLILTSFLTTLGIHLISIFQLENPEDP